MNKDCALFVAGIMFGLFALVHLIRLFSKFEVTVGGRIIPMWVSVVGLLVAVTLSLWMFMA